MGKIKTVSSLIRAAAAVTAAGYAYWHLVRPRHLRWGASEADLQRAWPGDERVPQPMLDATHAVTVHAPAEKIWPWLVQMGQGRGGMYSYDWIENRLGLDIHTRDQILPEFQDLKVGDTIPLNPEGMGPRVLALEPCRYLLLGADSREGPPSETSPAQTGGYVNMTWLFFLDPLDEKTARLIERARVEWQPSLPGKLDLYAFWEPGAFIMERKMLLGIKKRAEEASGEAAGG